MRAANRKTESTKLVWISSSYPVVAAGLVQALEKKARVYVGRDAPADMPSAVIVDANSAEELYDSISRIRERDPGVAIIAFGLHLDLGLAHRALQAGARGFIHAGMEPDQIARAIGVALNGELVAPRKLLSYLITNEDSIDLEALTARQREVLTLVVEGLTNQEIAERLYLSESSVKQHLRQVYKRLGVKNRTEAAKLFREH